MPLYTQEAELWHTITNPCFCSNLIQLCMGLCKLCCTTVAFMNNGSPSTFPLLFPAGSHFILYEMECLLLPCFGLNILIPSSGSPLPRM